MALRTSEGGRKFRWVPRGPTHARQDFRPGEMRLWRTNRGLAAAKGGAQYGDDDEGSLWFGRGPDRDENGALEVGQGPGQGAATTSGAWACQAGIDSRDSEPGLESSGTAAGDEDSAAAGVELEDSEDGGDFSI